MLKKFFLINCMTLIFLSDGKALPCGGRFPNPITDICWSCLFPLYVGPVPLGPKNESSFEAPPPLACGCPAPPPVFYRPGVGISYWEPARVSEVVRTPFCSPTLNGAILGAFPVPAGTNSKDKNVHKKAFYHVHWIQYPVLNWLGMALTQGACFINETFDIAYLSELDPLWDEDELSFLINPEAALFANPLAQAACAADTVKAAIDGFGIDALFWCSGSQGSLYPLSGNHAGHVGGVDSSLALTHSMIFKLHRQSQAMDTSTTAAMCTNIPQPIMRKNQYKQQMLYPIPQSLKGYGLGAPSTVWGMGKEFPYKGEDFSYLLWRRRKCCAY